MNDENVMPMVCSVTLFDNYLAASTFHQILNCFNQLCLGLQVDPLDYQNFYHRLKNKLTNWKAQKLWTLLDKRASQKEYRKQKSCQNLRVLIIGAGPCGLRMAIECALLGCKVVLLEKRDRFSRNNVLHIWPFVIQDLKNLGAKLFYPKFCAGSIDHISIRQLQCMLLKVALLLGVEVHENVSFEELLEPQVGENGEKFGWRARVSPETHYVNEYEFDALIGADGKRNTVPGFRRKEFRGKLAIAITANFINRHTELEERVQEISGVAFIFNQQFFKDMRAQTGIDLENIVYYKDDTHYFVMTAKKQSLLDKNVIENDYDDISLLLHPNNIDQGALMSYAREAADFATESKLPNLEFAFNHHALPDVAMFDFTSLFSAENSCRLFQRREYRLLVGIVGDSLHEPFWPTGSGCARGFLSVFDASWMFKNYCSSKSFPLEVLAQRESTYRLLAQTTTENLNKNIQMYTIDPKSRYPRLECTILPNQARSLVDTDNWATIEQSASLQTNSLSEPSRRVSSTLSRRSVFDTTNTYVKHQQLIRWYQQIVQPYRLRVDNLTQSFRSGMVLNAVLHRFRPETTPDLSKLKLSDVQGNCGRAFDIVRSEFGVDPPLSVCDRNLMYEYLFAIYEALKKETPSILIPSPAQRSLAGTLIRTTGAGTTLKRKSPDVETTMKFNSQSSRYVRGTNDDGDERESDEKTKERHRRRLERLESVQQQLIGQSSAVPNKFSKKPACVEKLSEDRLKDFEKLFLDNLNVRKREVRNKKPMLKTRKLEQKELEEMEEKLKLTAMGHLLAKSRPPTEPNLSTHDARIIAEKTNVLKQKAQKGFQEDDKYGFFDKTLTNLERKLRLPNQSGAVAVATLLQQHNENIASTVGTPTPPPVPLRKKPPVPLPHEKSDGKEQTPSTPTLKSPVVETNQQHTMCFFCDKRVYLAEKLTIENVSCHISCFRCAYCDCKMRLNGYGMERIDVFGDGRNVRQFFCLQHLNLSPAEKISKLKLQKEKRRSSISTSIDVDVVDSSTKRKIDAVDAARQFQPPLIDFKPLPNAAKRILAPVMTNNLMEVPSTTTTMNTLMPTSHNLNSSFSIDVQDTPERAEFEVSFRAGGSSSLKPTKRSHESLIDIENCQDDGSGRGDDLTKRIFSEIDDDFIQNIDENDEEIMEEEEVLLHNMGYSSRDALNEIDDGNGVGGNVYESGGDNFELIVKDNDSDDDENLDESDKDDDDSSDLSAAEETALADCLSKRAVELPSELTYEEAAIVAQTLKQQRSAESATISSHTSDDELDETDTSSDVSDGTASMSGDVDSSTESKHMEPKKKLVFSPPPTTKNDETIFFTPNADVHALGDVDFRTPQAEFKIPQAPLSATFKPKKVLYLHSGNDEPKPKDSRGSGDYFAVPDSPIRLAKMQEYERLREEQRAKAKLRSDEELAQRLRFSVDEIRNELLDGARTIRSKSASQEILPSPSKGASTSNDELTKRRANSEEAKYVYLIDKASSSIASNEPSTSVDTPLSDAAPSSATSKRSSIFSRLFNLGSSSPKSKESAVWHSPIDQSNNTSASTIDSPLANVNVTSESTRETNLLGKLGLRKYNRNKSRASSSPPKEKETGADSKLDATQKKPAATSNGIAPKATVDEMDLSDTSPESPVRSKTNVAAVAEPMKLSTFSNLSTSTVPGSMSLASLQSGDSSTINDRDIRRVQRAAAKMAKQQEQKRIHRAQEIQRSLQELDVRRQQIEFVGRDVERRLKNDSENKDLFQQWLDLVTEKDNLLRQEAELNLKVKEIELENEHCQLQQEIRERMNVTTTKTSKDLQEDKKVLERCLDIVSRRDELVTRMEKERIKEKDQKDHLKKVLNQKGFNFGDYEPYFLPTSGDSGNNPSSTEVKYKSALHSLV